MKFHIAVLFLTCTSSSQAFSPGRFHRQAAARKSRLLGAYEDYLESRKNQGFASPEGTPSFPPSPAVAPLFPPPDDRTPLNRSFEDVREAQPPPIIETRPIPQPPPIVEDDTSMYEQQVPVIQEPPIVRNQPPPPTPKAVPPPPDGTQSRTERILRQSESDARQQQQQATGAGGSTTWAGFQRVEANWARLKENDEEPPTTFVTTDAAVSANPECWNKLRRQNGLGRLDYDVTICGGTLGIFFAVALQLRGHNVCLVEAGKLRGRPQEWNISRNELMELIDLGILSEKDIEDAIQTEFPVCRSGFKNKEVTPLFGGYSFNEVGYECDTPDVLNLGVSPSLLLARATARFVELGGVIEEETKLEGVVLSETVGAALDLGPDVEPITTRLVLDCMGNASPISRQQRAGAKPDGICAVVGCCANGYDPETNLNGDIIYTMTPITDKGVNGKLQYFWESFPVGIGRNDFTKSSVKTTYMFTYMDADERRPSLETIMEDYWKLLPIYQASIENPETDLDIERVLFAYFPTYTDSPLQPKWSRILAVGDASGIQSPLSFGGFGALTRHLDRITVAIDEALLNGLLDKESLALINPYTPNLSAAWMFQKAMSVRVGQKVDERFVNRLLATNFEIMNSMGQRTIKPFLQDVIRFDALVGSLARSFVADPLFMPEIVAHVGIPRLADWLSHVAMMGTYDLLHKAGSPIIRPLVNLMPDGKSKYTWRRRMDAWKYGSGNDYILPEEN